MERRCGIPCRKIYLQEKSAWIQRMNRLAHRNEINWVLLKYIKTISGSHNSCKNLMPGRVIGASRIYICPVCVTFPQLSVGYQGEVVTKAELSSQTM